jgi:hypothetical protein
MLICLSLMVSAGIMCLCFFVEELLSVVVSERTEDKGAGPSNMLVSKVSNMLLLLQER